MGTFQDIAGTRFNRLVVLRRVDNLPGSNLTRWECQCDCGNITQVSRANLTTGHTTSCGCYAMELAKGNKYGETHGQSRTRLYSTWQGMKQRCYDKNVVEYQYYGAKGISVCEDWMDFPAFSAWAKANGYKRHLTIDRIDNAGNYTPENCRWVTAKQQSRNKTTTRFVEFGGVSKCVAEWSEELGIPTNTINNRLNRGMGAEDALNTDYYKRIPGADEEARRIILYKQGLNDREAAEVIGIKRVGYYAWRRKRGLPANKRRGGQ